MFESRPPHQFSLKVILFFQLALFEWVFTRFFSQNLLAKFMINHCKFNNQKKKITIKLFFLFVMFIFWNECYYGGIEYQASQWIISIVYAFSRVAKMLKIKAMIPKNVLFSLIDKLLRTLLTIPATII